MKWQRGNFDANRYEGLVLTIPYSILAKKIDRRIILIVNVLSSLLSMLFMIAIGKFGHPLFGHYAAAISIASISAYHHYSSLLPRTESAPPLAGRIV